jgi:energy-coupling factor transporter ATP-binding protein EcfA2
VSGYRVAWEGVRFGYAPGSDVLHGVSLAVEPGECLALLGPNGAGKTTLTRMLMGLIRPREGTVTVGDWDVAGKRPDQLARRVGYVFQHADRQLFARTVRDDVGFGPRRLGLAAEPVVESVLAELELAALAERHPWDLPLPLRKLAALAGVLAMEPGVLVLDEPTGGFDAGLRSLVVAALRRRIERGITAVVVSHDLELVAAVATRRSTLERGAIADR